MLPSQGPAFPLGLVAKQQGDKVNPSLDWMAMPPRSWELVAVPTKCSLARATDDIFFSAMKMFD